MSLHIEDIHNAIKYLNSSLKWENLIKLSKESTRENPYKKHSREYILWEEQVNINLPILYLGSIYLYLYAQEKRCNTFIFATRDCCHWYKIFKAMYPNTDTHYFHCSRKIFEDSVNHHNSEYKSYVKSIVKDVNKTVFIDVHGTGRRMFTYFHKEFKDVPYCFLLSATFNGYSEFPEISRYYKNKHKLCNLVFHASGSPIEMLNYDKIGTLDKYTSSGPKRKELEYDYKIIKPYHKAMKYVIRHIKPIESSNHYHFEELRELIEKIYRCIKTNKPNVMKYITHESTHRKN